jgi:hypothetical protein
MARILVSGKANISDYHYIVIIRIYRPAREFELREPNVEITIKAKKDLDAAAHLFKASYEVS